jgi:hypothetical protein
MDSLAHMSNKTPSYDTKILLKVVFDKTAFVKFKISNNLKQNIDETHSKNKPKILRKIHPRNTSIQTFAKSLKFPKRKPSIPQGMYLKIHRKSIA